MEIFEAFQGRNFVGIGRDVSESSDIGQGFKALNRVVVEGEGHERVAVLDTF